MDLNRRSFLELAGLGSIGSIIPMAGLLNGCTQPVEKHPAELPHLQTAKSEGKLWEAIRQYYIQHPNLVNLNSGACSPSAIHVLRVFQEAWQVHNQLPGMSLVQNPTISSNLPAISLAIWLEVILWRSRCSGMPPKAWRM